MKTRIARWAVVLAAVIAVLGVTAGTVAADRQDSADRSRSSVQSFAEPDRWVGYSTLTRSDDDIRMMFRTSELAPKEALTIWWVVFNQPENCTAPGCGEDDIFIPGDTGPEPNLEQIEAADIVVAYATGKVSSSLGRATFAAELWVGDTMPEVILGTGAPLKLPREAEIHLVARSHGPAVPTLVDDQIGSFAGGCGVFLNPPEVPDAVGECGDVQFSVHLP